MAQYEKRFEDVLVSEIFDKLVLKASQVKEDATINEIIDQMLVNPTSRKVYVVDGEGRYIGTVSTEIILRLMGYRLGVRETGGVSFYRFLRDILKEDVKKIMVRGRTVTRDQKVTEAMKIMIDDHLNDIPVVDAQNKLIGELVSLELFLEGKRVFERKD